MRPDGISYGLCRPGRRRELKNMCEKDQGGGGGGGERERERKSLYLQRESVT